jgi:hypothetical protein
MRSTPPHILRLSRAFSGFAILLLADVVAVLVWNPDPRDAAFWVNLILSFGTLTFFAQWVALRLRQGRGVAPAASYLSIVWAVVGLGLLLSLAVYGRLGGAAHWALEAMRTLTAAYLVGLTYATWRVSRRPN